MESIKSLLLKRFLIIFLMLALLILGVIGVGFRQLALYNGHEKALEIASIVKAGLTAHMKSGIMDRKNYFLTEIRSSHQIDNITVIRSESVTKQFGKSGKEWQSDPFIAEVFKEKKARFNDDHSVDERYLLRAAIPYIANQNGALNCLSCHRVQEGDVLGVVDIVIDLSAPRSLAINYMFLILTLLLAFILISMFFSFKIIERYVVTPLTLFISRFNNAIISHSTIDPAPFQSAEFHQAICDGNLLIQKVIHQQEELNEKNKALIHLNEEIENTLKETLYTIGMVAEQKSKETGDHLKRVVAISGLLATYYGLEEEEIERLTTASQLHDIGKIAIEDGILNKPGKLTPEEYESMKRHTTIGHEMLKHSHRDILKAAAIIALDHHERYDGKGYPNGKKAEEIHLYARIVSVADVFDALYSKRCYKEAWAFEKVMEYFEQSGGAQFDSKIVGILLEHHEQIRAICDQHLAQEA